MPAPAIHEPDDPPAAARAVPEPPVRRTVVVVGLGDTGVMVATRLAQSCRVVAVTTRMALVSGQELGSRLVDPQRWRRHYFVPLHRFRRLDGVEVCHGRVTAVDLDASTVQVERVDGTPLELGYDALVIASGVSNGFWRDDRVEALDAVEARIAGDAERLTSARTIAVVGGGAAGVSTAANLARAGHAEVHLFFPGTEPLPEHHPRVRQWMVETLRRDGVRLHSGHRAALPGGVAPSGITDAPVEWSSGQQPFTADAVVWAVGAVRPHTSFLPRNLLDEQGFVRVDAHLQVTGHPNVFAVGDVAASDPLRSSARNWGHRVVVSNVRKVLRGRAARRKFRAPRRRWGSIIGLQPEGLTVAQPNGRRFRIPFRLAEPLLYGTFVTRGLYGGLRPQQMTALFDRDCGLCDRCVAWLEPRVSDVQFVPMQQSEEENESLVVRSDGREWRAEAAVAVLLRRARARRWRVVGSLLGWWGVRRLARPAYRWVAEHRTRISARMGWQSCRTRSLELADPEAPLTSHFDDEDPGLQRS